MFSFQLKNIRNKKMSLFMETSIPKVVSNYSYTRNLINKFRPRVFKKSMIQIVNEPFYICGCK
jgi:hypothetical protein